ncbi:MAG: Fe3+/spermidine/putrescine ABC transporter ATP-binding protein, partial [Variovorax sp.]
AQPYAQGEEVLLSWQEADARVLGPGVARPSERAAAATTRDERVAVPA